MGFLDLFHKHEDKEKEKEESLESQSNTQVVELIDPGTVLDENFIISQGVVVLEGKLAPDKDPDRILLHEIPDGPEKLKECHFMKGVGKLNEVSATAITSTAAFFRTVEVVRKGAIPLSMVAETLTTAVDDFKKLTSELDSFRKEGTLTMDDISHEFEDILLDCNMLSKMIKENEDQVNLLLALENVSNKCELFLKMVNEHLKKLQSLRLRTARTWLASTGIASITVGSAAAALCVLSGGTTLPVLAPVFAFGAGSTAVATASHIAFSPSLGNQIKDLDSQISELHIVKDQAGVVNRQVESKSNEMKRHKWKFWT